MPLLTRTLEILGDLDNHAEGVGRLLGLGGTRISSIIATDIWDFEAARSLAARQVRLARDAGALVQLQFALNLLASGEMLAGDFDSAAALIEEDRSVAEATDNAAVAYAALLLAAYQGREAVAVGRIRRAREEAGKRGEGRIVTFADWATSVLHNGLGQHDIALAAARRVVDRDVVGGYQVLAISELAEAASRTGDEELLNEALGRLSDRASATPDGRGARDRGAGAVARRLRLDGRRPPRTVDRSIIWIEPGCGSRPPGGGCSTANG